jgi:hypothetical protein
MPKQLRRDSDGPGRRPASFFKRPHVSQSSNDDWHENTAVQGEFGLRAAAACKLHSFGLHGLARGVTSRPRMFPTIVIVVEA